MLDPAEEQRAGQFRRTQAARQLATQRRERVLRGSSSAYEQFRQRWWPFLRPVPPVAENPDSDRVN